MLVHHDLELGSDLLLLIEFVLSLGTGHLCTDNVPSDECREHNADDKRHQEHPRRRTGYLAVDRDHGTALSLCD